MVSSTVGSSTRTGWKRRSRAASVSMYLRYSSSVVAPMQWSSPLASMGFKRLPASMDPSVLPAPTIRCSSSMKRMIRPSDFRICSSTAFSLSSNSPRYFAPAIRDPMSSEKTVLFFRPSGTSPRMIRCARPSAMAVLPTPGSPISTGLFFVLRDRIRMTERISLSRPITGSILPFRARSTRSVPYFDRASTVSSGLSFVTRKLRTEASAFMKPSFVTLYCLKRFFRPDVECSKRPSIRCSTETYSSFICFATRSAKVSACSVSFET